jgi:hypothetical protein
MRRQAMRAGTWRGAVSLFAVAVLATALVVVTPADALAVSSGGWTGTISTLLHETWSNDHQTFESHGRTTTFLMGGDQAQEVQGSYTQSSFGAGLGAFGCDVTAELVTTADRIPAGNAVINAPALGEPGEYQILNTLGIDTWGALTTRYSGTQTTGLPCDGGFVEEWGANSTTTSVDAHGTAEAGWTSLSGSATLVVPIAGGTATHTATWDLTRDPVCELDAEDDSATVDVADGPTVIDVLANDTPCGPAVIEIVNPPALGEAVVTGLGVVYRPNGVLGRDQFRYSLTLGDQTVEATVHVTVFGCQTATTHETYGDNPDSPRPWGLRSRISWCADGSLVTLRDLPSVEGTISPVLELIPFASFQWDPLEMEQVGLNSWSFSGTGHFCADPLDPPLVRQVLRSATKVIRGALNEFGLMFLFPDVHAILVGLSPKGCLDAFDASQSIHLSADGTYSLQVSATLRGSGEVSVYHNGGDISLTARVRKRAPTFTRVWQCSIVDGCA